ncbi:transglycosylase SLT domain-containing protein [Rhizobium sp. GN54]|uniref:transglycosylase SLT domain-containing protein n=1 Tax=Rhizobium sp. GN54 TaxID=2898150 RepID=UPI001E567550|nr:transporter substrate-binding domain-containing protein [Rhizobium sp. GN54]MCD2181926.1 transporter substrate-binding domain-containing protein [Rhizobium sp. GN54]
MGYVFFRRTRTTFLALAAIFLQTGMAAGDTATLKTSTEPHLIDYDEMAKRQLVRVLVPFSKTIYFIDAGKELGTAVEYGRALEEQINKGTKKELDRVRVIFLPTPRDRLLDALVQGYGDIVMANLTITDERLKLVDFTAPLYGDAREILVTGPGSPAVKTLDDLGGRPIDVRASSSYREHLEALNVARKAGGQLEIGIGEADENLEDEDLMEMVNAGLLPWTIVDAHKAAIWSGVFTDLTVRDDIVIADEGRIAWAIRKNSPLLKARLDAFVADHKIGTTFGNLLRNRYYKSDKIVRRAYAPADVERFRRLVEIFQRHGDTYAFDYLMLAAQGYQESQLDQSRRSPRGAVGIMQLLPSTARDKAIGISGIAEDADRNVEAGAKYLRHLIETYIADVGLAPTDRQLFAFAAYNAGPGNLRKFRRKAEELGLDPDIWFGNVENAASSIVGRETVQYVANIYKYYIAYRMLSERTEDRLEVKEQIGATTAGAGTGEAAE